MGNTLWIFNLFQINSTIEHEHEQEHHLAEIIVSLRAIRCSQNALGSLPLAGKFHSSSMYPRQLEPFQLFFIEQSFKFERPRASIKIEVVSLPSKKHLLVLATRIDCHSALSISSGSRLKFFEISRYERKFEKFRIIIHGISQTQGGTAEIFPIKRSKWNFSIFVCVFFEVQRKSWKLYSNLLRNFRDIVPRIGINSSNSRRSSQVK